MGVGVNVGVPVGVGVRVGVGVIITVGVSVTGGVAVTVGTPTCSIVELGMGVAPGNKVGNNPPVDGVDFGAAGDSSGSGATGAGSAVGTLSTWVSGDSGKGVAVWRTVGLRRAKSSGTKTMGLVDCALGKASGVGIGGRVLSTVPKPKGASLNSLSVSVSRYASPVERPPIHSPQDTRITTKANETTSVLEPRKLRMVRNPPLARLGKRKHFEVWAFLGEADIPSLRPATAGTPTWAWFPGMKFACRELPLHPALFHRRPGLPRKEYPAN